MTGGAWRSTFSQKSKGYPQMTQMKVLSADKRDKKKRPVLITESSFLICVYLRHLRITLFLTFAPTGAAPLALF
jgi:hypothetical protein